MSGLDNTSYTVRTVSTTTATLTANDYVLILTSASAKTVNLPAASAVIPGRVYVVVNTAANTATLTPASGTINGAATFVTPAGTAAGAGRTHFISDGTTWWTISGTTTA